MGRRWAVALAFSAAQLTATGALPATPALGQALEMSPNLSGVWIAEAGVIQFNVLHRFQVLDPPSRKVLNTPTFLVGAGVGHQAMVGFRYATSSLLVHAEPNEWEAYGLWAPVAQERAWVDGAVRAGWNGTAGSADGELAVARGVGPVRVHLAGRGFSAWRGGDPELAVAAGAVWRLHRWVALAADAARVLDGESEPAWGAGLQLAIPYSPHTLSLHASNVNATTLQSSTVGIPGRRLWGFEFTVPITLSRYFGGRRASAPAGGAEARREPQGRGPEARVRGDHSAPSDTAVVTMDDRLRFLPDTIRVRAGQAVRWENTSVLIHTVTADPALAWDPANVSLPPGAAPFDSGDMLPEGDYTHVFRVPGVYRYVCLPHERAGMVGVVIVEGD